MGNKIGKTAGKSATKTRFTLSGGSDGVGIMGSRESLATAVSMNSHQCLLINNDSTSSEENLCQQGVTLQLTRDISSSSDNSQTKHEESDQEHGVDKDGDKKQDSLPQVNLAVPDHILKKLTTEDWNELVHIFCHTLETSLQSTIPQNVEVLRNIALTSINTSDEHQTKQRSSSIHYPAEYRTRRQRKKRPVSLPPNTAIPSSTRYSETTHHHHAKPNHTHTYKDKPTPVTDTTIDDNCPGKHKMYNRQSYSGALKPRTHDKSRNVKVISTEPCDHCRRKNCKCHNYLTLGQLKDLGLALKTDSPLVHPDTPISMECFPSNNDSDFVALQNRTTITSPKSTNKLEQLCYLGPIHSFEDEQDSSISNMAVADYDVYHQSTSYHVQVKHLHKHRHSHIHVVHHTLSQPTSTEHNFLELPPGNDQCESQ